MSLSLSFPPMATKEREKSAEKDSRTGKMFVGVVWNCAAELKLLLTALLILCTIATLIQFFPPRFSISTSDIRLCISRVSPSTPPPDLLPPSSSPPPKEKLVEHGIVKRSFNPYGSAAYNFITMGAYRGGPDTFAIVGLASKPLHVYGKPKYQCRWTGTKGNDSAVMISTDGYKILPDWGYGRVYTAVVVNCTFPEPINLNNSGGKLIVEASTFGSSDRDLNLTDTIEALEEQPGSLDINLFSSEPKYDYLYCGSSLYGDLSPQRVREWMAYHVRLFGERSHFVIHDAGGVQPEVLDVLRPWMELGYVTLQDIREQERFDGYYHNQFMVVNDCLHRYKFMAKWMFFFDVDEYIYVSPENTLRSVLDSLSDYTQFTIQQVTMSSKLCFFEDDNTNMTYSKWGMEKLVYRDVKKGIRRDRKYAVQPRSVYATGVHMSQNLAGKTSHKTDSRITYFHYHGTIANRREPCRSFVNSTWLTDDNIPYALDTTMRDMSSDIKSFELKMIGPRLQNTRQ